MGIISHAHVCIYWWIIHSAYLQNVSNKPMKFHDDNQNNTQYVRIMVKVPRWAFWVYFAEPPSVIMQYTSYYVSTIIPWPNYIYLKHKTSPTSFTHTFHSYTPVTSPRVPSPWRSTQTISSPWRRWSAGRRSTRTPWSSRWKSTPWRPFLWAPPGGTLSRLLDAGEDLRGAVLLLMHLCVK